MIKTFRLGRLCCVLLLGALAFLTLACGGKGDVSTSESPDSVPPPSLNVRPDGLAREFLDLVRAGKYAKAYTYFSVDLRINVTENAFTSGLTNAMKVASTRKSLANRGVISERIVNNRAIVEVGDLKYTTAKTWKWEFEKTDSGWKILSLDLPPITSYKTTDM